MSRRALVLTASFGLLALISLAGARAVGDRFVIVLDRHHHRPKVERFGPKVPLGSCLTQESDDPSSDVLANAVDVNGDGRADYRFTADLQGDHVTCEARRAGFWFDRPMQDCTDAVSHCRR